MSAEPTTRPRALRSVVNRLRGDSGALRAEVDQLRAEVGQLREEVQESRRLHVRVAELTDVVQELLLPAISQDPERLTQILESYAQEA